MSSKIDNYLIIDRSYSVEELLSGFRGCVLLECTSRAHLCFYRAANEPAEMQRSRKVTH